MAEHGKSLAEIGPCSLFRAGYLRVMVSLNRPDLGTICAASTGSIGFVRVTNDSTIEKPHRNEML